MKKLVTVMIVLVLAFTVSACGMFHNQETSDAAQNSPCAVEKPCCKKMTEPCPKPCSMEPGAQGAMPCNK